MNSTGLGTRADAIRRGQCAGRRQAHWGHFWLDREGVHGGMAEAPAAFASCAWRGGGESQATLVETKG